MHLRADDGIRTRDPHLGKVMRYQLRYIRAQRPRSSPGAKHDDSPPERAQTNFSGSCASRLSGRPGRRRWRVLRWRYRASVRRRSPLGAGPVAQWKSVRFTRGRSLVRSQPGPQSIFAAKGPSWDTRLLDAWFAQAICADKSLKRGQSGSLWGTGGKLRVRCTTGTLDGARRVRWIRSAKTYGSDLCRPFREAGRVSVRRDGDRSTPLASVDLARGGL